MDKPWFLHLTILILIFSFVIKKIATSHFRGGIITWKPTEIENQVAVTFRMSWRRTYSTATFCDQSTIHNHQLIADLGSIKCFECGRRTNVRMSDTGFFCTDFSVQEDWVQGERTFKFDFTDPVNEFGFSGNAWITLVHGGDNWILRTTVNLTQKTDSGQINSSPVSAMPPIVRIQHMCNHTIKIPVHDADNNVVRCRWALSSKHECGGVCNAFRNAILIENQCEIQYSAMHSTGWYAVAIQIEDFRSDHSIEALSSVPLQFLVYVFESDKPCQDKPQFKMPTRLNGACVGIPYNSSVEEKLIARSGANGIGISEINTVSPPGTIKSDLDKYDNSGRSSYVNITWSYVFNQDEEKTFCYTARDTSGLESLQRCIQLSYGVEAPSIVSYYPQGDIQPTQSRFLINYDRKFVKPNQTAHIYFFHENGTIASKMNANNITELRFPYNATKDGVWQLEIPINFKLEEKMHYYIKLDPGIAKGVTSCGAESSALWNPDEWKFRVRDVTPPELTFDSKNPTRAGGNITVQWFFNEAVKVHCTLQNSANFTDVFCTETSWTGTNLQEGYYTLYVKGTDLENNTATPSLFTWFIDKTGPSLQILTLPRLLSNEHSSVFKVECSEKCKLKCSLKSVDEKTNFVDICQSQLQFYHLISRRINVNKMFVFQAKGVDEFGNEGNVITYQFETDFKLPFLQRLTDKSILCNQSNDPNITGIPLTSDENGILELVHYDQMIPGCRINRTWTAYDKAGNSKSIMQIISIKSPSPPNIIFPPNAVVACRSLSQVTEDVFKPSITISHPCGLKMTISYKDPPHRHDGCGTTFTRTWKATDLCYNTMVGNQTINIMDAQNPITPKRHETTDLHPILSWPEGSESDQYKLVVWSENETKPTSYKYFGRETWYKCTDLLQGTKYYWQVYFIADDHPTKYSPRWNFNTKAYPDLSIIEIKVPPLANSGQPFDIQWKVQNIGRGIVTGRRWMDKVFIQFSKDFRETGREATFYQSGILFQNDTYRQKATLNLDDNDIGTAYVFVKIDAFMATSELDTQNNLMRSDPVHVQLTPPPDLIVSRIDVKSSTYSGENIPIRYTVTNAGRGTTKAKMWTDSLYWSDDKELDKSDLVLRSTLRRGILLPGESYTVTHHVTIPRFVNGLYYIIAKTDVYDTVFEYQSDDNNWLASDNLTVILTPPPDLIVTEITTDHNLTTGDILHVEWTVTNIGSREPYISSWNDKVVLQSRDFKRVLVDYPIYAKLPPSDFYKQRAFFIIDANIPTGIYNLSVETDARHNVFEYGTGENNVKSTTLHISEVLPDLEIEYIAVSLTQNVRGNNAVQVTWRVRNVGRGRPLESTWSDVIEIENNDNSLTKDTLKVVSIQESGYVQNKTYTRTLSISLSEKIAGHRRVYITVDKYNVISKAKNIYNTRSQEINIPLRTSNFKIGSFLILNNNVTSGNTIQLKWNVKNDGVSIPRNTIWRDTILVQSNNHLLNQIRKHTYRYGPLKQNESYTQVNEINVPKDFVGVIYLQLILNSNHDIFEGDKIYDNEKSISINVLAPPSPNLFVTSVNGYIVPHQNNVIIMTWTIKNTGNSMLKNMEWVDEIGLKSINSPNKYIVLLRDRQILKLESGSQYTMNKSAVISSEESGKFYAYAFTDCENDVQEIDSENDNLKQSDLAINIEDSPKASLVAFIMKTQYCYLEEYLCIQYNVSNTGETQTQKTSWNDAIYVKFKREGQRSKMVQIASNTHIGELLPGDAYIVNISVSFPTDIQSGMKTFLVIPDFESNELHMEFSTESVLNTETNFFDLFQHTFYIQPRTSCANLNASFNSEIYSVKSGDPSIINYNITNTGNCNIERGFFVAVYMSSDIQFDLFERKIRTNLIDMPIAVNETICFSTNIQLPFESTSKTYFLVLQVDSLNQIIESNEYDNVATSIVNVQENVRTDLIVLNVSSAREVYYGQELHVGWSLLNNGSIDAEGYKCDSVYLSKDSSWDIYDELVGKPQCMSFRLNSDTGVLNSFAAPLPQIGSNSYKTIVKARANIVEPDLNNNIGVSLSETRVMFQQFPIGQTKIISLTSYQIFQIPNVTADETILIKTIGNRNTSFHIVYVKYERIPTEYDFDFSVETQYRSNHEMIVHNTKKGNYFTLVKRSEMSDSQKNIELSITITLAKFEIFSTLPNVASTLGNVTLKITGSLIPEDFSASLEMPDFVTPSIKNYWFSSTFVAATFDATQLKINSTYGLNLTNTVSGEFAYYQDALLIQQGIQGQISVKLTLPSPLLVGERDLIHIDLENIGNTDVLSPIIQIQTELGSSFRDADTDDEFGWTRSKMLIASSNNGPGGIFVPSETRRLSFEVKPSNIKSPESVQVSVSVVDTNTNSNHFYLNLKDEMKPKYYSEEAWEDIWNNFICLTGNSLFSLSRKISETLNEISMVEIRHLSLEDVMYLILKEANGYSEKKYLIEWAEIGETKKDDKSDVLDIIRTYPISIGARRSEGCFGIGWSSGFWENKIVAIDEAMILLKWGQEEVTFTTETFGIYQNNDKGKIILADSDLVSFTDLDTLDVYEFNISTGNIHTLTRDLETVHFAYDQNGQLVSIEEEDRRISIVYDDRNRIHAIAEIGNNIYKTCSYSYSDRNTLSKVNCGDQTFSYIYNEKGDLTEAWKNDILVSRYQYNSKHVLCMEEIFSKTIDGVYSINRLDRSFENGRINVRVPPGNLTTFYWINPFGRFAGVKRSGFPIEKFVSKYSVYEKVVGDLIYIRRNVLENGYEIQDADGDKMKFRTNEDGRIVTHTDGNDNTYRVERSFNDSEIVVIYPDDSNDTYLFKQNELIHTDQTGEKIRYIADDTAMIYYREAEDGFSKFTFAEDGQWASIENDVSTMRIAYDTNGLVQKIINEDHLIIHQEFNYNQMLTRSLIPGENYNIVYEYDSKGRIKIVKNEADGQILAKVKYNNLDLISSKTLGNNATTYFTYYSRTRLLKTLSNYYSNGTISFKCKYFYDRNGKIISMLTTEGKWHFTYDLSGQLLTFKDPQQSITTLTYDHSKNRKYIEKNGRKKTYITNELNQYVTLEDDDIFSYDKRGNLISKSSVNFSFDSNNRVQNVETKYDICQHSYNAIGYLKKVICKNHTSNAYTDSFGNLLKQNIWRQDDNKTIHYIYGSRIGLIAAKVDDEYQYYQYDAFGSVLEIQDAKGQTINSFTFDPFGQLTSRRSDEFSLFTYLGQWNVLTVQNVANLYMIQNRLFDSDIGRFLSMDRKSMFCNTPNLYMFRKNNPLNISGGLLEEFPCNQVMTELKTVEELKQIHLITPSTQNINQTSSKISTEAFHYRRIKRSWKRNAVAKILKKFPELRRNKFIRPIIRQLLKSKKIIAKSLKIIRYVRIAIFIYKHRKCIFHPCDCIENASLALKENYIKIRNVYSLITDETFLFGVLKDICEETAPRHLVTICTKESKMLHSVLTEFTQILRQTFDSTFSFMDKLQKKIENVANKTASKCRDLGKKLNGTLQWIRSHDPNDLIGPKGFGAARFIPKQTEMIYKIRFENDVNATAPAQKVFIELKFDRKWNPGTFRLGAFGFGSFDKQLNFAQSFIQDKINYTIARDVFVDVRGGLDIVNNRATWEFQSVTPSTGLPPTNPEIGFLPPNNGTSGQGFITFSVRLRDNIESLEKVRAKATIIFDENEPIETPEVFNTVDITPPVIRNITAIENALESGTLILNVDIKDNESGLDFLNILVQSGSGFIGLVNNVRENIFSLPVQPGRDYTFAILPVDHVGNILPVDFEEFSNIFKVTFPQPVVTCEELNNCSGNGLCLEMNYCACSEGFYGIKCDENTPPLDPPVLDAFYGEQSNISIPLHLSAKSFSNVNEKSMVLSIICTGFPDKSLFSVGKVVNDSLVLQEDDFGDIMYMPPSDFTGIFILKINAFAEERSKNTTRRSLRNAQNSVDVRHSVSEEERQLFKRTYLKPTISPTTTKKITQITHKTNPSGIVSSPLYTYRPATTSTARTTPQITKSVNPPEISTSESPKLRPKSENADAVKHSVIAGLAGTIGGLFIITVCLVFISQCRKSGRQSSEERARRKRRRQRFNETVM